MKGRKGKFASILCCIVLVGCISSKPTVGTVNPFPAAPTPMVKTTVKSEVFLVRSFALPADKEFENKANILIFPKRPATKSDREKYEFICEQWKASFPTIDELSDNDAGLQYIPFVWMLSKKAPDTTCKTLIDYYDYGKSQLLARRFNLSNTSMYIIFSYPNNLVTMDLTTIVRTQDLELAIDTWKRKMTSIPRKPDKVTIFDLAYSAKAVLGALAYLITFKS